LYPIHSTAVANYRKTFQPSGAKSDLRDSALILDLVMKNPERFRPQQPDTVATRSLQFLTEERRKLVDRQTAETQRLIGWLKQVFPQILEWFDDVSIPMVGALLKRWPVLEKLQAAETETLEDFFRLHNSRAETKIAERIAGIRLAVAATHDPAVLQTAGICIHNCILEMEQKREAIAAFDRLIAGTLSEHPDRFIVASLPGAGPVLEPRLIAAVGSIRERFDSADSMNCFAGVAPVKESSGKACWIHWRWNCPKFIRQTFHEWAGCSIRYCGWAREFYDKKRAGGMEHHPAVRALAFKWIRIYYRCWRDRVPYSEAIYLESLQKAAARITTPLPAKPASSLKLQIQWKTSAGFSKPANIFA
jgi:transposase